MPKNIFFILLFTLLIFELFAQEVKTMEGVVSYVNTTNVYVKFENTKDLSINDTLSLAIIGVLEKALIVKIISSKSCITTSIISDKITVGQKVTFSYILLPEIENPKTSLVNGVDSLFSTQKTPILAKEKPKPKEQTHNGRLSVSTNGSMNQAEKAYNRLRTSFNFDLNNINGGKVSLSTYINYQRRIGVSDNQNDVPKSTFKDDFKVYGLSLDFDANEKTRLSFGRKINYRMSNMGAIDGIQYEHTFSKLIAGAFVGTRPDQEDYSFNKNLMQYGAFLAHESEKKNGTIQTSLIFAEQKYKANTDRRFAYFQHSNSVIKKVNIFYSLELDLFQNIDSVKSNKINLTSAYFSIRYKPYKKLSISSSYDNRRNVIYYETFRTYLDQLINQETRQGIRLQMNYNISKLMSLNLSGFYRYQESRPDPTKNYVANLYFSQIPGLNATLNLNANTMKTYYMDGDIFGARLNKDFFKSKVSTELNYRKVNYKFFNSDIPMLQDVIGLSTNFYFNQKTALMFSYEATIEPLIKYNRYYITLSQRFRSKKQ